MTPEEHRQKGKRDTLDFRIWAHCDPIGWGCTPQDVADALEVTLPAIRGAIRRKGWTGRMRSRNSGERWRVGEGAMAPWHISADGKIPTGERVL